MRYRTEQIVRLPMFVVMFGSFYCAMLGPFTTLISTTDLRTDGGRTEVAIIAVYAPLAMLRRIAPPAREHVAAYIEWWDVSRW